MVYPLLVVTESILTYLLDFKIDSIIVPVIAIFQKNWFIGHIKYALVTVDNHKSTSWAY